MTGIATQSRAASVWLTGPMRVAMPTWTCSSSLTSRRESSATSRPSKRMRPASGACSPAASSTSVVLPVPRPPQMAPSSPAFRVKEPSLSTVTARRPRQWRLETASKVSRGTVMAATASG